jgi:superfamily II DNA or RNA helicase
MRLVIETPTKAFIEDYTDDEMASLIVQLTYTNTAVHHQMKRHANNHFWRSRNKETWQAEYDKLKAAVKNTLIFEEDGRKFIRPGSIPYLTGFEISTVNNVKYPKMKKVPWAKPLPFELHPYQDDSWQKLIEECLALGIPTNVELCTGAGKSAILLKICREAGLNAAIIAPSKSIFHELLEKFEYHLGKGKIGAFGDGKKKLGKQFTICIGDSIANVKEGTPEWEFFSKLDMMCVDESHTWGADSLEEICHGVLSNVPYRFFFSGTQTRGDGTAPLLQSIIGKTVCTLTTMEAVAKGYICPHEYRIVEVQSSNPNFNSQDALEMKRAHFLGNKNIAKIVAQLANATALASGKQTLVLVEELGQVAMLTKLLKVPFAYAHSEKKADRLAELGLEKVNPAESVEKFNRNEVKVLIGTSCISTGTNIFPTHSVVNWVGGSSEIKTKQGAVGRAVRKGASNPWADKCVPKDKAVIFDFDVIDCEVNSRHLALRLDYYGDSGPDLIKYVKLK